MARLYVNRVKPNPRKGEKFSVITRGGQTFHKYGPGRVFSGGPRPKTSPTIKPPAVRPAAPAAPRPAAPPVGPAPVGPAPMVGGPPAPPDPRYDNEIAGAQRTRDTSVAGVDAARTQGLIGYGYTEGPGGQLNFDPNNAFSKAAQLKRNYDGTRRSTGNTMAASGNLYAGAYQSAQDVVNRGELGAQDELQSSLAQFLADNSADRGRAQTAYEEAAGEAESDRVGRIEDNPLYEPTVGYGSPVAGAGAQSRATAAKAAAAKAAKARAQHAAAQAAAKRAAAAAEAAARAKAKKKGKK